LVATPLKRVEPLLEAAVVGVEVVDVQMGRFRGWLSRREHRVGGNPGSAGEGGDWPAAVADQMVVTMPASAAPMEAPST
jgi:hypothetical protein